MGDLYTLLDVLPRSLSNFHPAFPFRFQQSGERARAITACKMDNSPVSAPLKFTPLSELWSDKAKAKAASLISLSQ